MQLAGKVKIPEISLEDQIEIFNFLGFEKQLNTKITNPLRKDTSAGCILCIINNEIILKDFASDIYGNCFRVYAVYKKVSMAQAYEETLKLINPIKIEKKENIKPTGTYTQKKITSKIVAKKAIDIKYFNYFLKYFIQYSTLIKFRVSAGLVVTVSGTYDEIFRWTEKEPCFVYSEQEGMQIYRPLSKKSKKWRMNCKIIHGLEQLDKRKKYTFVIITKSRKDVMVLYELGYPAIAIGAENFKLSIKELRKIINTKYFIVLLDNDKTGIKAAKELVKQDKDTKMIVTGGNTDIKDISDYILKYGKIYTANVLAFKILLKTKQ